MFLWLCDVELMIIDRYLPKLEWLVMDIYFYNDYNIFFPGTHHYDLAEARTQTS